MSYDIVLQKKFKPDGTGGNRKTMSFASKDDFEATKESLATDFDILAQDVSSVKAGRLICQMPDICLVIDCLMPMFDANGQLCKRQETIDLQISKAVYGITTLYEQRELYQIETIMDQELPENLKNISPFSPENTDLQFFIKKLRGDFPLGIIFNVADLKWFLNGLVTITRTSRCH